MELFLSDLLLLLVERKWHPGVQLFRSGNQVHQEGRMSRRSLLKNYNTAGTIIFVSAVVKSLLQATSANSSNILL